MKMRAKELPVFPRCQQVFLSQVSDPTDLMMGNVVVGSNKLTIWLSFIQSFYY